MHAIPGGAVKSLPWGCRRVDTSVQRALFAEVAFPPAAMTQEELRSSDIEVDYKNESALNGDLIRACRSVCPEWCAQQPPSAAASADRPLPQGGGQRRRHSHCGGERRDHQPPVPPGVGRASPWASHSPPGGPSPPRCRPRPAEAPHPNLWREHGRHHRPGARHRSARDPLFVQSSSTDPPRPAQPSSTSCPSANSRHGSTGCFGTGGWSNGSTCGRWSRRRWVSASRSTFLRSSRPRWPACTTSTSQARTRARSCGRCAPAAAL